MFGYDHAIKLNDFFPNYTIFDYFSIKDFEHYFQQRDLDINSFDVFEVRHTNNEIVKWFNPPTDFNREKAEQFLIDYRVTIQKHFEFDSRFKIRKEDSLLFEGWYQLDYCGQLRFRLIVNKESGKHILISPNRHYENDTFPTKLFSAPTCNEIFSYRNDQTIYDELNQILQFTFTENTIGEVNRKQEGFTIELLDQKLILARVV